MYNYNLLELQMFNETIGEKDIVTLKLYNKCKK